MKLINREKLALKKIYEMTKKSAIRHVMYTDGAGMGRCYDREIIDKLLEQQQDQIRKLKQELLKLKGES